MATLRGSRILIADTAGSDLSVGQYDGVPTGEDGKGGWGQWRQTRCFKCGVVSLVVLVVLVVCLRWGIAPPLAQHTLDDATLSYGEVTLSDPSETMLSGPGEAGHGHFTVEISTKATIGGMPAVDATVEPFYLTMSYQGGPPPAPPLHTTS